VLRVGLCVCGGGGGGRGGLRHGLVLGRVGVFVCGDTHSPPQKLQKLQSVGEKMHEGLGLSVMAGGGVRHWW
jgi:hypothetical protein